MTTPTFFASPAELRSWLEKHHASGNELWVGFYKKASGIPSITWGEAVDQALCFGWIDGVRKSVDDKAYMIRFTPRRPRSIWSAKNIARFNELARDGLVRPSGRKAFEARSEERSGVYSYEQRAAAEFEPAQERQFRRNKKAWEFFQAQRPSYRRAVIWWVVSAKKEETKAKRLAQLIEHSSRGRTVPALTPPGKR